MDHLEPELEIVGITGRYNWELPLPRRGGGANRVRSAWYVSLPLTSAHRGSHSGGGALLAGVTGQEHYLNEGTVYPHASLVEIITYHERCFPHIPWRYVDLSHIGWETLRQQLLDDPPDVIALTVYSATSIWAYILAATAKLANPDVVIVFGNDHASVLHREILTGRLGGRLVDFVGTGNNGPFTMMNLIYALNGCLDIDRVPSIAFRNTAGEVVNQAAATFPLDKRVLPDYRLILPALVQWYDPAFNVWYAQHYDLKRMVTLPIDGGCNWGKSPRRRCKHCSIQGLTPKTANVEAVGRCLEVAVGEMGANVYAAGDSTLGFSSTQWGGGVDYLDRLAEICDNSAVLKDVRFLLAYGLVHEFLESAALCAGFVRTWNVGLEAFDPKLLREDSKGINKDAEKIERALDLARRLDYRIYASGILGLPGTTQATLNKEVDSWLGMVAEYGEILTTVSLAPPAIIPGSRMYAESYKASSTVRAWHGELPPARQLTEFYLSKYTEVTLEDVESALTDVWRGVLEYSNANEKSVKYGGYMFGGDDVTERAELTLLEEIVRQLR